VLFQSTTVDNSETHASSSPLEPLVFAQPASVSLLVARSDTLSSVVRRKPSSLSGSLPSLTLLLSLGVCAKSTASQRARAKKSKIVTPKSLCPSANEVACPIVGSSSYQQAVAQHFTSATEFSGVFAGEGGCE
jgi:hypothetical protein